MRLRWLLPLLALAAGCGRHPEPPAVARVDGEAITAEDFRIRYGGYLEAVGGRDNIALRKKILDNMINELLMLADVRRRGLDTDRTSRSAAEEIRTRQMLLGYAQRITLDTMTVTEAELREEFRRYQTRVSARYLYAATEDSARRLKEALDRGRTFEELARRVFSDPGLAGNGGSLGYFGWGELDPAIERLGYTLPLGAVSEPFRFERGWALLRVDNRVAKPLASETDYAKAKPELLRAIQKRKVLDALDAATERLKADLTPSVDTAVASRAYDFWRSHGGADPSAPLLEPSAADRRLFGTTVMRAGGREWSVDDLFRASATATARERARVRSAATFRDFAVGLAVREETVKRARAAGLDRDTAVQAQVAQMTRDYLLRRWKQEAEEAVRRTPPADSLLRREFENNRSTYVHPPEVNVAEILLRRKGEADSVARKVRAGAGFAATARARSIRLWAAARGGELGYAPPAAYGPLGEKFLAAAPGTIVGPEFVDPYYGVFKILGRRDARPMSYDEARERVSDAVEAPRIREALKRGLEALRAAAAVDVDETMLANVSLH